MKRREFIFSSAALSGLSLLPQPALASSEEKRFIFVFNQGGWDPTRVFAQEFNNPLVSMELLAEENNIGNVHWVAHPDRPSVDSFFESHHQKTLLINGLQVRSIAHEICTCIAMTGGTAGNKPDWATILGSSSDENLAIPHLVLGGPNFSGQLGAHVVQTGTNNQLEELLDGSIRTKSNIELPLLSTPTRSLIDQHIVQRAYARDINAQYGKDDLLSAAYKTSIENAQILQNKRHLMSFSSNSSLDSQIDVAIDSMANNISRCTSLVFTGNEGLGWDSHADNDDTQSALFEQLFSSLNQLIYKLLSTVDTTGTVLADNTVVVVFSEMGRTASLNGTNGKDHWPFTSMMLWGDGITGDRVIGTFDSSYQGSKVDLDSGELFDSGALLGIESVGASLLELGGIDSSQFIQDADPLLGILS